MKQFLKFMSTLCLTGVLSLSILIIASRIFVPKWVDHDMNMMTFIIKGFYNEKKNSLDVVIGGNSDTYRGVNPIVMYNEYGIASYNFVSAGQRMWHAYAMFQDVLRTQNPKIYLFNVDGVFSNNQASKGNNGKVYDNMEFSSVKINAMFDKYYKADRLTRVGHILPILSYHSRYSELTIDDFKYAFYDYHYSLKGMDMVAYRVPYNGTSNYMKKNGKVMEIPAENEMYLNKMREECKKRNIKFVLFHTPSSESADYPRYKAVQDYADKYNLDFFEMNYFIDDIGIDWKTDTSDGGDHLNLFGAEKVSRYLGKYLKDNYDLPDRREDSSYSDWNEDYEYYLNQREIEINTAIKEGKY